MQPKNSNYFNAGEIDMCNNIIIVIMIVCTKLGQLFYNR